MEKLKKGFGFTLIELVVSIGVLAILLSIVMFAVNPTHQFAKANNTKRRSDIIAILDAVGHYMVDNHGLIPSEITTSVQKVSKGEADLCADLLVTQKYIAGLPEDPTINSGKQIKDCSSNYDTGFTIVKDANNRVTVAAPLAEIEEVVSITR